MFNISRILRPSPEQTIPAVFTVRVAVCMPCLPTLGQGLFRSLGRPVFGVCYEVSPVLSRYATVHV